MYNRLTSSNVGIKSSCEIKAAGGNFMYLQGGRSLLKWWLSLSYSSNYPRLQNRNLHKRPVKFRTFYPEDGGNRLLQYPSIFLQCTWRHVMGIVYQLYSCEILSAVKYVKLQRNYSDNTAYWQQNFFHCRSSCEIGAPATHRLRYPLRWCVGEVAECERHGTYVQQEH
jgi:hypothetical protein